MSETDSLYRPDQLPDLIDAPEFKRLKFDERKTVFEQGVRESARWIQDNGGWTPETFQGFRQSVSALRNKVGESESWGEAAMGAVRSIGRTARDSAAAAGTYALDSALSFPPVQVVTKGVRALATGKPPEPLRAPMSDVGSAFNRNMGKQADAFRKDYRDSQGTSDDALESALTEIDRAVDSGDFLKDPKKWLTDQAERIAPIQRDYHAQQGQNPDAENVSRYLERNRLSSAQNLPYLLDYIATANPESRKALRENLLKLHGRDIIETQDEAATKGSETGRMLDTLFGEGASRYVSEAGDPMEVFGNVTMLFGGKAATTLLKSGFKQTAKTALKTSANAILGAAGEALSEIGSFHADNPNATREEYEQVAKEAFVAALGLQGLGAGASAGASALKNRFRPDPEAVMPNSASVTEAPVHPATAPTTDAGSTPAAGTPAAGTPSPTPSVPPSPPSSAPRQSLADIAAGAGRAPSPPLPVSASPRLPLSPGTYTGADAHTQITSTLATTAQDPDAPQGLRELDAELAQHDYTGITLEVVDDADATVESEGQRLPFTGYASHGTTPGTGTIGVNLARTGRGGASPTDAVRHEALHFRLKREIDRPTTPASQQALTGLTGLKDALAADPEAAAEFDYETGDLHEWISGIASSKPLRAKLAAMPASPAAQSRGIRNMWDQFVAWVKQIVTGKPATQRTALDDALAHVLTLARTTRSTQPSAFRPPPSSTNLLPPGSQSTNLPRDARQPTTPAQTRTADPRAGLRANPQVRSAAVRRTLERIAAAHGAQVQFHQNAALPDAAVKHDRRGITLALSDRYAAALSTLSPEARRGNLTKLQVKLALENGYRAAGQSSPKPRTPAAIAKDVMASLVQGYRREEGFAEETRRGFAAALSTLRRKPYAAGDTEVFLRDVNQCIRDPKPFLDHLLRQLMELRATGRITEQDDGTFTGEPEWEARTVNQLNRFMVQAAAGTHGDTVQSIIMQSIPALDDSMIATEEGERNLASLPPATAPSPTLPSREDYLRDWIAREKQILRDEIRDIEERYRAERPNAAARAFQRAMSQRFVQGSPENTRFVALRKARRLHAAKLAQARDELRTLTDPAYAAKVAPHRTPEAKAQAAADAWAHVRRRSGHSYDWKTHYLFEPVTGQILEIPSAGFITDQIGALAAGVKDLAAFTTRLAQRFGDWIKPHARDLWNAVKEATRAALMKALEKIGAIKFAVPYEQPSSHARAAGIQFTGKPTPPPFDGAQLVGTCVSEQQINAAFGDMDTFERLVQERGDEFTEGDTTVSYNPRTHEHFFWKHTEPSTSPQLLPPAKAKPASPMQGDMGAQMQWMEKTSRGMGHESADALAATDPAAFARLGAQWRVMHERDAEGNFVQNAAIHDIFTKFHGTKLPKKLTATRDTADHARSLARIAARASGSDGSPNGTWPDSERDNGKTQGSEKALLVDWARDNGLLIHSFPQEFQPWSDKDKGAQEHHVFSYGNRVVKITKEGGYGLWPVPHLTQWDLRPTGATPGRYLSRIADSNALLGDDIVLHAVYADRQGNVQIVTSQPRYGGQLASDVVDSQEALDEMEAKVKGAFAAMGFVPSSDDNRTYYRPSDNTAIFDAHLGNLMWVEVDGTPILIPFDVTVTRPTGKLRQHLEENAEEALVNQQTGQPQLLPPDSSSFPPAPERQPFSFAGTFGEPKATTTASATVDPYAPQVDPSTGRESMSAEDARAAVESFFANPDDPDYWPADIRGRFDEDPLDIAINYDSEYPDSDPDRAPLLPEPLRSDPKHVAWRKMFAEEDVDGNDPRVIAAHEWTETSEAQKIAEDNKARYQAEAEARARDTIKQLETRGWKWDEKSKTFGEDERPVLFLPPSVRYPGRGPFKVENLVAQAQLTGSPLPKVFHEMLGRSNEEKAALKNSAARLARDLDAEMRRQVKLTSATRTQLESTVNNALDDPNAMALLAASNPALHACVLPLRNMLDTLSTTVASWTSETTGDTILGNLGSWLRRSYMAFDPSSGWSYDALVDAASKGKAVLGQTPAAVILRNARAFLQAQNPSATPDQITIQMKLLTDRQTWLNVLSGNKDAKVTKDVTSLIRRKEIPAPLRALMGEVRDPLARFGQSASFQAQFIARHEMQQRMRDTGLALGIFSPVQTPDHLVQVGGVDGADANPVWSGFGADLWTTPQMLAALRNAKGVNTGTTLRDRILDTIAFLGGKSKEARVALSPDFYSTNIIGAVLALAGSGDLTLSQQSLRSMGKAMQTLWMARLDKTAVTPAAKQATIDAARDLVSRLESAGVLSSGVNMDELLASLTSPTAEALTNTKTKDRVAGAAQGALTLQGLGHTIAGNPGRLAGAAVGAALGGWAGMKNISKPHRALMEALVSTPDLFAKLTAYLNNRDAYLRSGLSAEDAHAKAVEVTRNTMPDYSKVPAFLRELSRLGIIGSFIAFRAESYRNLYWNARYAAQELRSGNPALRLRGAQRLMGIALSQSLAAGKIAGIFGLLGYLSDADDEEDKAYRRALARKWDANAQLVYDKLDANGASYFSADYLVPQASAMQIIRAAVEGRSLEESMTAVASTIKEQAIGGNLVLQPLIEAYTNSKFEGNFPVSTKQGWEGAFDRALHVLETMEPGYASKAKKLVRAATGMGLGRAEYTFTDEALRTLGLRMNNVKHEPQIRSKLSEFNALLAATRTSANAAWSNFGGRTLAPAGAKMRQDALDAANAERAQIKADFDAWLNDLSTLRITPQKVKSIGSLPSFAPLRVTKDGVTAAKLR